MKKTILVTTLCLYATLAFAQHQSDVQHIRDNRHEHHDGHHNPPPPHVRIATPEDVEMVYDYINGISFDKDKAKGLVVCMTLKPLRAEDLTRIVKTFGFDDEKVKVLQSCYPLCPNKEKYMVTLEAITFSSNKDKMTEFLSAQQ